MGTARNPVAQTRLLRLEGVKPGVYGTRWAAAEEGTWNLRLSDPSLC